MKKIILVLTVSMAALFVNAQSSSKEQKKQEKKDRINQMIKQEEEGTIIFNKQGAFGIKLSTDGYGIFYEHGKYKTVTKTFLWWAELSERKHPKEEKSPGAPIGGFSIGNPYVYGKINNFYYLNLGLGGQRLIGGKGNKNGIAVSAIYGGGFSAGLLKPYYLTVGDSTSNNAIDIRYTDQTAHQFIDATNILGAAGFTKGFSEIKFVPGVHARLALRFDYGRFNELLSAVETGITAAYYTQDVAQMIGSEPKKFFFNAYVAVAFGKRK